MARRSNPRNIYNARRTAVLSRLTQERRLSEQRAEARVAAWEVEGDSRGLERMTAKFWDHGMTWSSRGVGCSLEATVGSSLKQRENGRPRIPRHEAAMARRIAQLRPRLPAALACCLAETLPTANQGGLGGVPPPNEDSP